VTSLLAPSRPATVARIWQQHRVAAGGFALTVAVAYGLGAGFAGVVERITSEVPAGCAPVPRDVDMHSTSLAWELLTDGNAARQIRTDGFIHHPVDRETESVPTEGRLLAPWDDETRRQMPSATCGSTTTGSTQNHSVGIGAW
jgi:hypothetical protein